MSIAPVPQHCPSPVELDDLELLTSGALAGLGGLDGLGGLGGVGGFNQPDSPVTLTLPEAVAAQAAAVGAVELVDPEGLPLARVAWPEGTVEALTHPQFGPFRSLALTPAAYREQHAGRTVVPVSDPLTHTQLDTLAKTGPLTLLTFTGTATSWLSPTALIRATQAAARLLPDAVVVTTPLPAHGDPETDHTLGQLVVTTFAAGDPVHPLTDDEGEHPAPIQAIIDQDRPPPEHQGLVVFFTGLSGSGKSTLARALVDLILEHGQRTVTSLDGDVVRRNLSTGLTFSREDRETNIRRIGWVAAEITRHRGIAVVSPIAPYHHTRQHVRTMVEDAGGAFFLIHVATPLDECERRDRKGLYAKARRGEIPDFTGISSPYEQPEDADVRVDTTGRTIPETLNDILTHLEHTGNLHLRNPAEPAHAPLKVLFVCTANICRSPSMELLARSSVPPGSAVVFSSAGTHGYVDHPVDDAVRDALPADMDASSFRSRRLTRELLDDADLVLTAEAAHRTFILDDHPAMFRKVFTLGQFAHSLERAPEGLDRAALLEHVSAARGNADPSLDVPDPYRRGTAAASECVAHLEELLRTVLPALTRS